jgi:predicted nucleic acid-binding protein
VRTWIVDTGPLVAYLDRRDAWHTNVVASMDAFDGRLITTGAVVTEAMHLVGAAGAGPRLLAELITASGTRIHEFNQPRDLLAAVELMERFADTPMDYADATLLLLAARSEVHEIATLDRRGFSIYRTAAGKALSLVLD